MRGGACRYSHEGNISQRSLREHDFGSDTCRNFLAGRCDRVHCRYSHGGARGGVSIDHAGSGDSRDNDTIRGRFKIGVGGGGANILLGSSSRVKDSDTQATDNNNNNNNRYWKYHARAAVAATNDDDDDDQN
mgnify:CR=1 FL=1